MARWFTKGFLERAPQTVAGIQAMFAATPLEGYLACGEAVRDMDQRALLPKIKAPTLVIAGKHDGARRRKQTSTSATTSRAPSSRWSTPRISRTSAE